MKKQLQALVNNAFIRMIELGYKTQNMPQFVKTLFEHITSEYYYCEPWHQLLSNEQKFLAAALAYHLKLDEFCKQFYEKVDLVKLTKEAKNDFFNDLHLVMLCDMTKLHALQLLSPLCSIIGSKMLAENIIRYILQKINKNEYIIANELLDYLSSLKSARSLKGRYYAKALLTYRQSDQQDVWSAMDILVEESERDLKFWILLNALIRQCFTVIEYLPSITRYNNCWLNLSLLLRVSADYILREKIETDLQIEIQKNIRMANKFLISYWKSFINNSIKKPYQMKHYDIMQRK